MAKMAKTHRPVTVIDDEGYETDGMYRWGGKPKPYSSEAVEASFEKFNKCFTKPAVDRVAELRVRVSALIQPHVDGPHSQEELDKCFDCTISYLNLSSGSGAYAIHKRISDKSYLDDALSALHSLDELESLLGKSTRNVDRIVRASIEFASRLTRAELRAWFAPQVLSAAKRRKASAKGGKTRAKWDERTEEIARPIFAEMKRARLSDSAAYQRTSAKLKAEHGITISAKTLKRHLAPKTLDKA